MTASKTIAKKAQFPAGLLAPLMLVLGGLNPKAQLLLLCARIGYSPH